MPVSGAGGLRAGLGGGGGSVGAGSVTGRLRVAVGPGQGQAAGLRGAPHGAGPLPSGRARGRGLVAVKFLRAARCPQAGRC